MSEEKDVERLKIAEAEAEMEKLKRAIELSQVTGACKVFTYFNTLKNADGKNAFDPPMTYEQILNASYALCGVERKEGENYVPEIVFKEPNRLDMID